SPGTPRRHSVRHGPTPPRSPHSASEPLWRSLSQPRPRPPRWFSPRRNRTKPDVKMTLARREEVVQTRRGRFCPVATRSNCPRPVLSGRNAVELSPGGSVRSRSDGKELQVLAGGDALDGASAGDVLVL